MTRANTPLDASRVACMRAALYRPMGQHAVQQRVEQGVQDDAFVQDDDLTAVLVSDCTFFLPSCLRVKLTL